jgi:hypothetical protein
MQGVTSTSHLSGATPEGVFGIWAPVVPSLLDFLKFQNLTFVCVQKLWCEMYKKIYIEGAYIKKSH